MSTWAGVHVVFIAVFSYCLFPQKHLPCEYRRMTKIHGLAIMSPNTFDHQVTKEAEKCYSLNVPHARSLKWLRNYMPTSNLSLSVETWADVTDLCEWSSVEQYIRDRVVQRTHAYCFVVNFLSSMVLGADFPHSWGLEHSQCIFNPVLLISRVSEGESKPLLFL